MGKILFVASVFSHLETFHVPFMLWLQLNGHDVHAAASQDRGSPRSLLQSGVTCWTIPFHRSPFSAGNLKAFVGLGSLLSAQHYDLVHVHTPVAAFIGRLLSRLTKQGAVVYTAHGFHFHKGASIQSWMLYYWAERLAARWTDSLVVMNQEDYASGLRLGYSDDRLFYVHGVGVDLNRFRISSEGQSPREVGPFEHKHPIFICVGELNRNKNQEFLLRSWREYSSSHPGTLLIVGDGTEKNRLVRMVKRHGIRGVHFMGHRTDVPNLLKKSDVAVLTSQREGLPRCLLEAMAAGKPIIATNVRGSRDIVENGANGLLIEPGDTSALTSAIATLAEDKALRQAMGLEAINRVQEYSLEKVILEMSKIYRKYV